MKTLLDQIKKCEICKGLLPHEPRPVVAASKTSRILIIGQAPGRKVHETGIPWDDPSGNRLREWMGVNKDIFYDTSMIALVPMGFCYPGKGKSGDLPPRPECAPSWHSQLLDSMPNIGLTILIGNYAQKYYLKEQMGTTLTETVRNYRSYPSSLIPLPHPSPRNIAWFKNNPWFGDEVLPHLKESVQSILNG